MNQLNKLIEHIFLEEILYRGSENAVWKSDQDKFVARLSSALASRPTCGKEQRLFLDEVEKEGEYVDDGRRFGKGIDIGKISAIYQFDTKADLQKVIKGE